MSKSGMLTIGDLFHETIINSFSMYFIFVMTFVQCSVSGNMSVAYLYTCFFNSKTIALVNIAVYTCRLISKT